MMLRRYHGKLMRVADVAAATGLPWSTVRKHFAREPIDVTQAITNALARRKAREDRRAAGISAHTVYNRVRRGWSLEDAANLPPQTGGE